MTALPRSIHSSHCHTVTATRYCHTRCQGAHCHALPPHTGRKQRNEGGFHVVGGELKGNLGPGRLFFIVKLEFFHRKMGGFLYENRRKWQFFFEENDSFYIENVSFYSGYVSFHSGNVSFYNGNVSFYSGNGFYIENDSFR
jgi:hypothetical protein